MAALPCMGTRGFGGRHHAKTVGGGTEEETEEGAVEGAGLGQALLAKW